MTEIEEIRVWWCEWQIYINQPPRDYCSFIDLHGSCGCLGNTDKDNAMAGHICSAKELRCYDPETHEVVNK